MSKSFTYADAGVDIDKADQLIDTIKSIASKTRRPGVMGEIGGFGGLFSLHNVDRDMEHPVLVSSTDGVGTKLRIAFMMNKHDTVGIDLVAMSVNDIAVQGAKPLFFLDYLATGHIRPQVVTEILSGIGEGCKEAKCALIGGETAEMPDFYKDGEYDLAGFVVGLVDDSKIIDGSEIRSGDKIIGISSSGLHSNGFSLVRKIFFDVLEKKIDSYIPELGMTLGEELIRPTRIYSELIQSLIKDLPIKGLAHITGGGIANNIIRIIPKACNIVISQSSWDPPVIFKLLKDGGKISDGEMMRTFNNGIGLVAVVPEKSVQEVMERLSAMNESSYVIGEVVEKKHTDKETSRVFWE